MINVKAETKRALKKETYPGTIVKEAVLLQYVVDARLDRAVESTLKYFMEHPQPLRNPVSTIALQFRDYEVRHLLWTQSDKELLQQVAVSFVNRNRRCSKPLANHCLLLLLC